MAAHSTPDSLRDRLAPTSAERVPTMCAWCQHVRDADGLWRPRAGQETSRPVDDYTHGICPACSATIRARQRARRNPRFRPSDRA
jgi:hypothetical protein